LAFTGNPKNQRTSVGKVLHELFKQDRSIFFKAPGQTVITNKFINKVISKVESNRNS